MKILGKNVTGSPIQNTKYNITCTNSGKNDLHVHDTVRERSPVSTACNEKVNFTCVVMGGATCMF